MQQNDLVHTTILIVDQQSPEVEQLQYLLQENHFKVQLCNTSAEAYSVCLKTPPSLIFSEISIQPYDGLELQKKLKKNLATRDVPFILTSKQTELEDKIKLYQLEIDDYISKPYHPEEAACRIESILQELETKHQDLYGFKQGGFAGNLEEMTLIDLLQTLELGEKSAIIHLRRNHHEGRIFVTNGTVVDAEYTSLDAVSALELMLGWLYGCFQLQIQNVERRKTIDKLNREIYHTGLQLQHQGKEILKDLPTVTTILSPNKSAKSNGLSDEEKGILSIIRKPISIFEIIVSSGLTDAQTLLILKKLIHKELVQFTEQHLRVFPSAPIEREIVEQVMRARKKNKNILDAIISFFTRVKTGKMKDVYSYETKNLLDDRNETGSSKKHLVYLYRSDLMLIRQRLAS